MASFDEPGTEWGLLHTLARPAYENQKVKIRGLHWYKGCLIEASPIKTKIGETYTMIQG